MTIDPRLRKKKKKKKPGEGGALMLNIRVRRIIKRGESNEARFRGEVRDALQHLLDYGEMPQGWQFMYVDWKNPAKHGSSWETGWPDGKSTDDPEEFNNAFERVVQDQIRMARVRRL